MKNDIAFEMAVSSIRFGKGVTREVGMDLAELGARHALVITDPPPTATMASKPASRAKLMASRKDSSVGSTRTRS